MNNNKELNEKLKNIEEFEFYQNFVERMTKDIEQELYSQGYQMEEIRQAMGDCGILKWQNNATTRLQKNYSQIERQLKIKQIIRKKFDENHQQRIYQLENILVKQGIPRTDVNVWSRYRQGQAKLDYLHTQEMTLYDNTCEIACKKLDYIESDFYQIISNPKQAKQIIQQSFGEDKPIKPYSDTFIATISAMAVFLLSFYCYPLPIILLREFADIHLTNFELAFSVAIFTPLISGIVYIGKKGKLSFLLLPVFIWLWYLIPYLLDLNAELISVETSDFQPATCYSRTRFTSRTFPCIYLNELDAPIKISKNMKIDDIEVVRLKYHPHTQEWQELQLEMLEER